MSCHKPYSTGLLLLYPQTQTHLSDEDAQCGDESNAVRVISCCGEPSSIAPQRFREDSGSSLGAIEPDGGFEQPDEGLLQNALVELLCASSKSATAFAARFFSLLC